MRSIFYDIQRKVMNTAERAEYSVSKVLSILGISRSLQYSHISFSPILDGRFNPMATRGDDEWIVNGFRRKNLGMSFMEIAITLMYDDIAYLSQSTIYRIFKKYDLITSWKCPV